MTEQITVTIDDWTFEYNPDLSGNVFIGGEFEIPMEVLLKFFMDLPIIEPVAVSTDWIEMEPGIYQTNIIAPDKLGPSVFLPPPLPGVRIDPEGEL